MLKERLDDLARHGEIHAEGIEFFQGGHRIAILSPRHTVVVVVLLLLLLLLVVVDIVLFVLLLPLLHL